MNNPEDLAHTKLNIENESFRKISDNILPPKLMQVFGKIDSAPLIIAIYKESDVWKIVPLKPNDEQINHPPNNQIIGIPTFEGYEFSSAEDIIRCEGFQKCTKVFLKKKSTIISSYNIGEFEKLLKKFGFFSTHKSHLINLSCISKYNKDGTLTLCDNSTVPVSRRRKRIFLEQFAHI